MKIRTAIISLLLVAPWVAQAELKERSWINGRPVTVITDVTAEAPADCQSAFERMLDEQGSHHRIHRSSDDGRALMIVSRPTVTGLATKNVKITLWKAAVKNGKTETLTWVYTVPSAEVNDFLDLELPAIVDQFTQAPTPGL